MTMNSSLRNGATCAFCVLLVWSRTVHGFFLPHQVGRYQGCTSNMNSATNLKFAEQLAFHRTLLFFSSSTDDASEDGGDVQTPKAKLDAMERAWRYAKKPLLSIGSKGATLTHGNSLRQLLEQHTVVKVKVNTRRFEDSLQIAFEQLCALAEENGAPAGIEMLQARDSEKIILFGLPGTMQKIKDNQFPPTEEKTRKE